MTNHYHLVVRLTPEEAKDWTDDEVLERWTALFKGPLVVQRYRQGETLDDSESETLRSIVAIYRRRLANLSWFMKCLNEPIARKANQEDDCTGHFWESRFSSQALCSDRALLSAMAYVDLNPVRAGMAKTPETSRFTSVHARINKTSDQEHLKRAVAELLKTGELNHLTLPLRPLAAFATESDLKLSVSARPSNTPMTWPSYLQLVDISGRVGMNRKRGVMPDSLSPILERIGLSNDEWIDVSMRFKRAYRNGDIRLTRAS